MHACKYNTRGFTVNAVSYDKFHTFGYSILSVAFIDMLPLRTKSAPTFVNIYGNLPVEQKNMSTQVDMILVVLFSKQLTPVPVTEASASFCDEETM